MQERVRVVEFVLGRAGLAALPKDAQTEPKASPGGQKPVSPVVHEILRTMIGN